MSTSDHEARERQRAWAVLGTVEDHPKVRAWLSEAESGLGAMARRARWPLLWTWAAAAGVALALGLGWATYLHVSMPRYETRVGEQRDVILADGSRVTLNTDTALTVRYSDHHRFIELERGEALFAVKHSATRPFDVAAGGTLTRALGTEFNVDMRRTKVTVSVLEGAVRVTADEPGTNNEVSGDSPPMRAAALAKGQALEFSPELRRMIEEKADIKRIDAWRTRRLEFSNTSLAEAVEEINRYSKTRVTVGTPDLASIRVSGMFRIGDTDGFLYSLREALRIETHDAPNEVVLVRTQL